MAIKSTRSKRQTASQKDSTEESQTNKQQPLVPDENPPYVFILPQDASPNSRIISIESAGASTDAPSLRYFVDPGKGFYEFTSIPKPAKSHRSWLLSPETATQSQVGSDDVDVQSDAVEADGYVVSIPDLLVATPINPLFVLLSIPGVLQSTDSKRKEYETLENRMWTLKNRAPQLAEVLAGSSDEADYLEQLLESTIKDVSRQEVVDDDDVGYSLDEERLADMLCKQAQKAAKHGLPASLEERFVKQPLQMPEVSVRREDSGISIVGESTENDVAVHGNGEIDNEASAEVTNLLRVKVALEFLLARYVPLDLRVATQKILKQPDRSLNFAPLDRHLEVIVKAKAEAQALRSISDNISRKRGPDDDEALEKAEAKKRKKEEEEQKKKQMSQGVKKLMKADTSGMKKMSSFFQKKT